MYDKIWFIQQNVARSVHELLLIFLRFRAHKFCGPTCIYKTRRFFIFKNQNYTNQQCLCSLTCVFADEYAIRFDTLRRSYCFVRIF